jgi:hypothetical protein
MGPFQRGTNLPQKTMGAGANWSWVYRKLEAQIRVRLYSERTLKCNRNGKRGGVYTGCCPLVRELGIQVKERSLSVDEIIEGAASGCLQAAFGTGAAVVSPVALFAFRDYR